MYDRFTAMLALRPAARVVHVREGEVAETYRAVLHSLD
jgi:hypothetical protein